MYQYLDISIFPSIKFFVRMWGIIDFNLMADHEARFRTPGDDEVSQVAVIRFHVALSSCQVQALSLRQSKISICFSGDGRKGLPSRRACRMISAAALSPPCRRARLDLKVHRDPECPGHPLVSSPG